MKSLPSLALITAALSSLLLLGACSGMQRKPVPLGQLDSAAVPGYPGVRTWLGRPQGKFSRDLLQSVIDETPAAYRRLRDGSRSYSSLIVSGGADYGAFGAGFLKGWSETGRRPLFKTVTGVSTGALIAPFAFLGPAYDLRLEESYTTITAKDVFRPKILSGALFGESVTDTTPLRGTIERFITDALIDRVAEEHRRGRRLFVGTTNLDAERFTVWNMGLIATSGRPDRYALFRQLLLASTAIPGAFPPVHIDVEADGRRFEEMHVDGGTVTQMFFAGSMVDLIALKNRLPQDKRNVGVSNLYIIRNGKTSPDPRPVKPNLVDISARSLSLSTKSAGFNDLYRIYTHATSVGMRFNYVAIPDSYRFRTFEPFDQQEMLRLFAVGYELGRQAHPWKQHPPGLRDYNRSYRIPSAAAKNTAGE